MGRFLCTYVQTHVRSHAIAARLAPDATDTVLLLVLAHSHVAVHGVVQVVGTAHCGAKRIVVVTGVSHVVRSNHIVFLVVDVGAFVVVVSVVCSKEPRAELRFDLRRDCRVLFEKGLGLRFALADRLCSQRDTQRDSKSSASTSAHVPIH